LKIGESGKEPGQLSKPHGIGVDADGIIVVNDSGNHRVQFFSPSGKFIRSFGQHGKAKGQLDYPVGLFVDPRQGNIIVVENNNHRIQIFTPGGSSLRLIGLQGTATTPAPEPKFYYPWGLAGDRNGCLVVCDQSNNRVVLLDGEDYQLYEQVGRPIPSDQTIAGLLQPGGVTIDKAGNLVIADSEHRRVVIYK